MAANRGQGANRVLRKLRQSIQQENYYEAHQMYRTLYFRYMTQQKFVEVIDLLYEGATLLLERGQHGSGADLCMLLVEALNKSAMPGSDELFDKIATLFTLLDAGSLERHPFVSTALNWTGKGRPEDGMKLHQVLAIALWKEKNYSMSRYHFLRSSDGEGCAKMLIEFSVTRGYPSEFDLFITQAVLQYLCLRNKSTANRVFNIYMERHPSVETGPPFKHTPLLNFLWFLLLAVEKGKLAIFTVLCEQYQPSIRRDPCYNEYLDRIGQLFFGVPPPRRPTGGIFGNLLSSIMGGLDDDDGDDMDVSVPTTSERSAVASKRLITEDLD